MNNTYNNHIGILHAFDPHIFKQHKHDEVYFVEGRYLDIANAKGKDPHALYFGTSKNSNLLTGIFLGDTELTSRVKDVSLASLDGGNDVVLIIKYINEKNKLATVKSRIPSGASVDEIKKQVEDINKRLSVVDSSIKQIYSHLNIIDSSVSLINDRLNIIDSSILDLVENLENGKYNYTIESSVGSFEDGHKQLFRLFKGGEEQTDSSVIELVDFTLKRLSYDASTNILTATAWPDSCGDDIYQYEEHWDEKTDTSVKIAIAELKPEYIRTTTIDLTPLEDRILEHVNTDTSYGSLNQRLIYVENQLNWDTLK